MRIGYARVSTRDQNLQMQIDELEAAGCEKIFEDKSSGLKIDRSGLINCEAALRKGDTLVVWKLDRLGRSVKHLVNFVNKLESQGINFHSIKDQFDTSTPQGKFFFNVIASLSQMERDLIAERTKAGMKAAHKRGRYPGRKTSMSRSKIESAIKLIKSGQTYKEVAQNLGISTPTLYRHVPASEIK